MAKPRSFGTRLVLLVTLASAGAALLVCLVLVALNYRWMRDEALEQLDTHAAVIGTWSAAALAFHDAEAGRDTLRALEDDRGVLAATLLDAGGAVFAQYRSPRAGDGEAAREPAVSARGAPAPYRGALVRVTPVRQGDRKVGSLAIVYDLSAINVRLRRNVALSLAASLLATVIARVVAIRLERVLARPIRELVATARRVSASGDYDARARKLRDDEMGQLTDAFNHMLDEIEAQRASLESAHERFRLAVEQADRERARLLESEREARSVAERREQHEGRVPRHPLARAPHAAVGGAGLGAGAAPR
jgi:methyl-accepting chemotaxis protein